MAKLASLWPSTAKPYRGDISVMRTQLHILARLCERSTGIVSQVVNHLQVLIKYVSPTNAVVANTQALVVPVTGTYATTATLTVAAGAVTAIVLS